MVSLGKLRDITSDVERDLASRGLHDVPKIYLIGDAPIVSAREANHLVREVKDVISEALASTGPVNWICTTPAQASSPSSWATV